MNYLLIYIYRLIFDMSDRIRERLFYELTMSVSHSNLCMRFSYVSIHSISFTMEPCNSVLYTYPDIEL